MFTGIAEFHASPALPNDVTVTLTGSVTGGTPPVTMRLNIEIFDPRLGTFVVVSSQILQNIPLNSPQQLRKTYFPADLLSITGQSYGNFRAKGTMVLINEFAPLGIPFQTPEAAFTLTQLQPQLTKENPTFILKFWSLRWLDSLKSQLSIDLEVIQKPNPINLSCPGVAAIWVTASTAVRGTDFFTGQRAKKTISYTAGSLTLLEFDHINNCAYISPLYIVVYPSEIAGP